MEMLVQMNELQIKTLEDIDNFLLGVTSTSISLQGGKKEVYSWIERTLLSFGYLWFIREMRPPDFHALRGFSILGTPNLGNHMPLYGSF